MWGWEKKKWRKERKKEKKEEHSHSSSGNRCFLLSWNESKYLRFDKPWKMFFPPIFSSLVDFFPFLIPLTTSLSFSHYFSLHPLHPVTSFLQEVVDRFRRFFPASISSISFIPLFHFKFLPLFFLSLCFFCYNYSVDPSDQSLR